MYWSSINDFVLSHLSGMVFEEEDFQLAMYGYRLNPDVSEQRVIGMLREVETELNETIHSSSNVSIVDVRYSF